MLFGRRFAPSLFATLLAAVGILSTINLGMWQLRRAEEKRAILTQIDAGAATTRSLNSITENLPRYQTVTVTGRYDSRHQVLLDNMPSLRGMPGFRVLTPFELDAGGWVLVDRGWTAVGPDRQPTVAIDVDETERTLVGRVDALPTPGLRLGAGADDGGSGWPRVMNFPQHEQLERALARPLAQQIVRLDPAQSDGFERTVAVRADFGPNRHIAYAVQWFAFAATMFAIYVLLNLKTKRTHDRTDAS